MPRRAVGQRVDVFTQGESWCQTRERAYQDLTPDFYRTIVMRMQYGVPFTFYAYHQYNWRGGKHHEPTPAHDIIMMGMQHYNHFNLSDVPGVEPCGKIWAFTEPFWTTSEFIPYWDAQSPASTDRDGLFCATYVQREEGRATIFVSNWNDEYAAGTVTLDFEKLGFRPTEMLVVDPLGEERRTVAVAKQVEVMIPARDFRAITLKK